MRRAILRIAGIGCEGCVAPSKALFLKVKGVRSVRVLGSRLEILYDDAATTIQQVIEESGATRYYSVEVESDEAL